MKRRRYPLLQLLAVVIYVVALLLLRRQPRIGLSSIGVLSIAIAVLVERRSGQIWKSYRRNYQPGKNKLMNILNKPRPIYNVLNVYVLWPAIFALGVYALYAAWQLK